MNLIDQIFGSIWGIVVAIVLYHFFEAPTWSCVATGLILSELLILYFKIDELFDKLPN